jgi:hypothetical protein
MKYHENLSYLADTFTPPPWKTVSHLERIVIPGEPDHVWRDPESRKIGEDQMILDPGSLPAPRDLAGMTNCDTASLGRGERKKREV